VQYSHPLVLAGSEAVTVGKESSQITEFRYPQGFFLNLSETFKPVVETTRTLVETTMTVVEMTQTAAEYKFP